MFSLSVVQECGRYEPQEAAALQAGMIQKYSKCFVFNVSC